MLSRAFCCCFRYYLPNFLRLSITSLFIIFLVSCSSLPYDTLLLTDNQKPITATYFDVDIYSFDGIKLRATVYRPALKPGETAPVILHAHGFGVFRMSGPVSMYAKFILSGEAALEAWKQGYWVISYDQRGHGKSGGMIHVSDPEFEGRDLSAVIDWAQDNLPRLTFKGKDPVIGVVGESYGGGAALMGSILDKRIDAIVPFNTWHNIEGSLYPSRVAKSGWLTTLLLAGNVLNPGRMEPFINRSYLDARKGLVREDVFQELEDHGAKYYCDKGEPPQADILFIQGFRDVLFNMNEGFKNFECAKKTGKDVRFIGAQRGHLLPFSQFSMVPGYQIERTVHCDGQALNLVDETIHWFDEKLKGKEGAAAKIPAICLTQDEKSGTVFSDIPIGGKSYAIRDASVTSGFAGFFELPMRWVDRVKGMFSRDTDKVYYGDLAESGGGFRPAFVPLTVIESTGTITGIPLAELVIKESNLENPIMFVGIGIKRKNSNKISLISDQITPIKGVGSKKIELAGISSHVRKGDIIGLVVRSYSDQYRFSGSGWLTEAKFSGRVELPIQESASPMPDSYFASQQMLNDRVINNE